MTALPSEFNFIQRGWFNGNSVLVQNNGRITLIDSGHLDCVDETIALIHQAGVDPAKIDLIAITHGHSDHHGANRTLKQLSNAPIGMGPLTAEWFRNNERKLLWFDRDAQNADPVLPDLVFQHNETVMFSDIPFEVVPLPGHAPDCIGYYQPDTKIMICADAMWENDFGVLNTAVHGHAIINDAEAAIDTLMQYDIAVAIPGHGGLITNVPENLAKLKKRIDRFKQDPKAVSAHLFRRMLMFGILCYQPIEPDWLPKRIAADAEMTAVIAQMLGIPNASPAVVENTVISAINEFIKRGLIIHQKDGKLTSTLPK